MNGKSLAPSISRREALRVAGLGAAGLSLGGCSVWSLEEFDLPPVPGLNDLNGWPVRGVSSKMLKGQKSLLMVFASWCPTCREQNQFLQAQLSNIRVPIYGILAFDEAQPALRYLRQNGHPFRAIGFDPKGDLAKNMLARIVPSYFLVKPDLRFDGSKFGWIDEPYIRGTLATA